MTDALRLTDVRLDRRGDRVTLAGDIGGQRLFWEMPDRSAISIRGEPFITTVLVSAMTTGRDLVIPAPVPVDPAFLASIEELQTIFVRWFPGLRRVAIEAACQVPATPGSGHLAGYSGGVDSSYTMLKLHARLDAVVLIDGIEYAEARNDLMDTVTARLGRTAQLLDLPLLRVRTNAKAVGRALGGEWPRFIGGALAGVPHALGAADYWIAGSNSWENLRPYGTHPITDPMWGSSQLRIHHHGAEARRIDKLAELRSAPDLLATLRVCFQGVDYNCGVCHKCLQTSSAMRALGIESPAVPPLVNPRLLRRLTIEHAGDLVDWAEIVPADRAMMRELSRLIRRYQRRQLLKMADAFFIGGRLRRLLGRSPE